MDIVTHGLAGGLVATAIATRAPWRTVAATVGGALAPDLDVLARLWDPLAPITVHRTATHSLVGGLLLALGVAGVLSHGAPRGSFRSLGVLAYAGVLSHIGLDLLTPFGAAIFWPLDGRRFGLGWLYVIDPVVIGIGLAGLLVGLGWSGYRAWAARSAVAVLAIYILVAGVVFRRAVDFRRALEVHAVRPTRSLVVPVFPGPLRWLGVAETDSAIYRTRFWIGGRSVAPFTVIAKTVPHGSAALNGLPEVRAFQAFARVPWVTVVPDGDAQIIEYRDLAFEDHPFGGPMALRLRLDRSGTVRTVELGHKL